MKADKCTKHPAYTGKGKPIGLCQMCWAIWVEYWNNKQKEKK